MIRSIFTVFIFALVLSSSSVQAQEDPDALSLKASQLIDSTMASLNVRAQRFNEELAKVNALKPMEVTSMTKEIIPKNREKIKDFLSFLEVYRTLGAKQKQEIEDSASSLRAKMPSRHRATFLKDFVEAYNMDQDAFDKYTLALSKVFTNVSAVLSFVETYNIPIKENKLQFSDKKDFDKYSELISAVEKSNKRLINASAASQKATIDASGLMQKAYGQVRK